eukprot:5001425-Lingulodinium_polyedra.AAC.1
MVISCHCTQQELHRRATDLESRLKEALDGKVPTMEAVLQTIDTKLAMYHVKVENRINELLAYIT